MTTPLPAPAGQWPRALPVAVRVPAWTAIAVVTGLSPDRVWQGVLAGCLTAVAAVALQFTSDRRLRLRQAAVLVTTVAGLGGTLAGPTGLAEIPVAMAAARIPGAFSPRPTRIFTVSTPSPSPRWSGGSPAAPPGRSPGWRFRRSWSGPGSSRR
jgi:hypothetical protein